MASEWNDILTNLKTRVETVVGVPTVKTRQDGRFIEGTDAVPLVLLCPAGPEEQVEHAFTNLVIVHYPVFLLYVENQDRSFTINTTFLDMREDILDTVDQRTLTGVTTIVDTLVEPIQPFTVGEERQTVYHVSGFKLIFENWETRAN